MDYEKIWKRLNREVNFLIQQRVESINPILLKGYMDFISQVVALQEDNVAMGDKILQAGI